MDCPLAQGKAKPIRAINRRLSFVVLTLLLALIEHPDRSFAKEVAGGILELRHEAGSVAKFTVTSMRPKPNGGGFEPHVWRSGDVTLGYTHTLYFPRGTIGVNVAEVQRVG